MPNSQSISRRKSGHAPRGPRSGRPCHAASAPREALSAVESLLEESIALFHCLRVVSAQVHGHGEMSAARCGVLRSLESRGPQTVPQIARAQGVSRQHILSLVNALADERTVELVPNPAHRRSRLVRLTPKGKAVVAAMNRNGKKLLTRLAGGIAQRELRTTARALRRARTLYEGARWKALVGPVKRELHG